MHFSLGLISDRYPDEKQIYELLFYYQQEEQKLNDFIIGGRYTKSIPTINKIKTKDTLQIREIDFGNKISNEKYLKQHLELKKEYEEINQMPDIIKTSLLEKFPKLEDYIEEKKRFGTDVLITKDRKWHSIENKKIFYNKYIANCNENYYFTIIDCNN